MKRKNQKTHYRLKTNLPIDGAGESLTPEDWFLKYGYMDITRENNYFECET